MIEVVDSQATISFEDDVTELLRLVSGLESGYFNCPCGKQFRVGVAKELDQVIKRVRKELTRRAIEAMEKTDSEERENSRFSLLEVEPAEKE